MATLILEPARTIDIDTNNFSLRQVVDNSAEKIITATIDNIWRDIILWRGAEEYALAGVWTNESALQRAKELIDAGTVQFA